MGLVLPIGEGRVMAWLRACSWLSGGMGGEKPAGRVRPGASGRVRAGLVLALRRAGRRVPRRLRRAGALVLAPVLAAGTLPLVLAAAGAVAVTAAGVVTAAPAKAVSGAVLILSTSVNGGASSAEAHAVPARYTVTVATPAAWDAVTTAQFKA